MGVPGVSGRLLLLAFAAIAVWGFLACTTPPPSLPDVDGMVVCSRATGRCDFHPLGHPVARDTTDDAVVFVPQEWYTNRLNEIDDDIRGGCRPWENR